MGEPRKVFRIEELAATRLAEASEDSRAPTRHAEPMADLNALRAIVAAATNRQSGITEAAQDGATARIISALKRLAGTIAADDRQSAASTARIAHELEAVISGIEQATQRILAAAEDIDQLANNLSAAFTGKIEQGLAQDIRDFVSQIFEACNFHDVAGQRITKVTAALNAIENYIACVLDEFENSAAAARGGVQYLHGPRIDSDAGHASQAEIDAMFERGL